PAASGAMTAPRWRFAILARLLPGVDAERVWTLRDLSEPLPGEVLLERRIASVLARVWPLVVAGVMLVFVAGLVLVWGVGPRLRYACYELIPLVSGFDRLASGQHRPDRRRIAVAWTTALVVVALFRPPFGYWLRVLIGLNAVTTVRFWTEHFDVAIGRAAHTY